MRKRHLGNDECKNHAKSLENLPRTEYMGLAVLQAAHVRRVSSEVVDSRFEFLGHADIKHGIVVPPKNEPLESAVNAELDKKLIYLRDNANYIRDPAPGQSKWTGPELDPKAVV